MNRREFIALAAAMGASATWVNRSFGRSTVRWTERRDLFEEGVAFGDPQADS